MSIRLITEVWKHAPFKRSDLLILLALADSANDDGVCWPSITTLSERGRINRRNTFATLVKLEEAGWLKRTSREGRSTIYTVVIGPSETTLETAESVAHDTRDDVRVSPTTGVAQDTPPPGGVAHDTGGVSPTTGGGVAGDTQNRKEPPYEPSSSSAPPAPYPGGGMPVVRLAWYPSEETVAASADVYPWATRVAMKEVTMKVIAYCSKKKRQPDDALWLTFMSNENKDREKAQRDEAEAKSADAPKTPWYE